MARPLIYYSDWPEVKNIHSYAMFMGYLSMAVKGMGYLVITWTTVVLLGGFVSDLQKKDLWSVTIITLVQTIRFTTTFPRVGGNVVRSHSRGFMMTTFNSYLRRNNQDDDDDGYNRRKRPTHKRNIGHRAWVQWLLMGKDFVNRALLKVKKVLAFMAYLVQVLVFAVVAGPIALAVKVLYDLGPAVISGLAVWRLVQRDYGGDYKNLRPALYVLYTLVLVQGVLSYYRLSSRMCEWSVARHVAKAYKLFPEGRSNIHHLARVSFYRYTEEMRMECEKNPSFVEGRSLVKYAVDLMNKSESLENPEAFYDFRSGASILYAFLGNPELEEHHILIKELLIFSASGDLLQKLVRSLDSTWRYHSQMMTYAARILAHLAGDPQGRKQLLRHHFRQGQWIHCIASLLEPPREEKGKDKYVLEHYQGLMVEGLRLLGKLVAAHEEEEEEEKWCRAVAEKEGLLAKIMFPLLSHDILHSKYPDDHRRTKELIGASIEVMRQLMMTCGGGPICDKLRRKISGNSDAMASIQRILHCDQCDDDCLLLQGVLDICSRLDPPSTTAMTTHFIKRLVLIFTKPPTADAMSLAGEMLATLSLSSSHGKENTRMIFQAKAHVIGDLTEILVQDDESGKCKISAAQILEQLCIQHTDDDIYVKNIREAMKVTMPKVLAKIIRVNLFETIEILGPVLSLSVAMSRNLMNAQDLALLFDAVTGEAAIFPLSILRKFKRMVRRLRRRTTVNELKTLKLVTEIFIIAVKHGSRETVQDARRLIKSLSKSAKEISGIEDFMVIAGCNSSSSVKTLDSLVRQAKEELLRREAPEMAVVIDHQPSPRVSQTAGNRAVTGPYRGKPLRYTEMKF